MSTGLGGRGKTDFEKFFIAFAIALVAINIFFYNNDLILHTKRTKIIKLINNKTRRH